MNFRPNRVLTRVITTFGLTTLAAGVFAQSNVPPEQRPRPDTSATALTQRPSMDGLVAGDSAWSGVVPTTGFTQIQPVVGQSASQRTEIFLGYTDDALYVGVIAYDENPSNIIVADSRRDSSLDETDSIRFVIDGLLDRQNGYLFGTNPAGVQYDAQIIKEGTTGNFGSGGGGFNLNWDGSWSVEATITDEGWSAEFEIPFTTLRYGERRPTGLGY